MARNLRVVVAVVVAFVACHPVTDYEPISAADVQARMQHVDTGQRAHLQAYGVAKDRGAWGTNVDLRELADACRNHRPSVELDSHAGVTCLLDDPTVTWKIKTGEHEVPDGGLVLRSALGVALLGALAYGNYECFGPGCGTGAKVVVGVADGVLVVGVVAVAVFIWVIAGHAN